MSQRVNLSHSGGGVGGRDDRDGRGGRGIDGGGRMRPCAFASSAMRDWFAASEACNWALCRSETTRPAFSACSMTSSQTSIAAPSKSMRSVLSSASVATTRASPGRGNS